MEHFLKLKYSPIDLLSLNRCRLYLNVIFLSDITSADGRMIIPASKEGHRLVDRINDLNWPIQDSPTPNELTLWRNALARFEYKWRWFTDALAQKLYKATHQGQYEEFRAMHQTSSRSTRSGTKLVFSLDHPVSRRQPILEARPATVEKAKNNNGVTIVPGLLFAPSTQLCQGPDFFDIVYSRGKQETLNMLASIVPKHTGQVVGVVHGDCEDGKSRFGWAVLSGMDRVSDGVRVRGRLYVSSCTTVKTALLALLHSLPREGFEKVQLSLVVPDKALIKIFTNKSLVGIQEVKQDDYDLVHALREELRTMSNYAVSYTSEEVTFEDPVNLGAKALVEKAIIDIPKSTGTTVMMVPKSCIAYIGRDNTIIMSNLRKEVYASLYEAALRENIERKEKWSTETFNKVDWTAYGKAFKQLHRTRQISYTKISHKLLQTNSQNAKFYAAESWCPCCQKESETFSHMLTCTATAVARERLIATYNVILKDIGTPAEIASAILKGLHTWSRNQQQNLKTQILGEGQTMETCVGKHIMNRRMTLAGNNS